MGYTYRSRCKTIKQTYCNIRLVECLITALRLATLFVRPADHRRTPCSRAREPRTAYFAVVGYVRLSACVVPHRDHHGQTTAGVRSWKEERVGYLPSALYSGRSGSTELRSTPSPHARNSYLMLVVCRRWCRCAWSDINGSLLQTNEAHQRQTLATRMRRT